MCAASRPVPEGTQQTWVAVGSEETGERQRWLVRQLPPPGHHPCAWLWLVGATQEGVQGTAWHEWA